MSDLVLLSGRVEFVANEVPLAEEFCKETERGSEMMIIPKLQY